MLQDCSHNRLERAAVRNVRLELVFLLSIAFLTCGSQEQSDWEEAQKENTPASYKAYLDKHPHGAFVEQAESLHTARLEQMDWESAREEHNLLSYKAYLDRYPQGAFVADAESLQDVRTTELAKYYLALSRLQAFKDQFCPYFLNLDAYTAPSGAMFGLTLLHLARVQGDSILSRGQLKQMTVELGEVLMPIWEQNKELLETGRIIVEIDDYTADYFKVRPTVLSLIVSNMTLLDSLNTEMVQKIDTVEMKEYVRLVENTKE